jgi:membrane protein DedA with SNARE-associated domain
VQRDVGSNGALVSTPAADLVWLHHYLAIAQPYLQSYGYAALFVVVGVEGFGIPAPGESLVVAAGFLSSQGEMSLAASLATAWLAAVAGDNIGYAIGHFGGRRLVLRAGVRPEHLRRVEGFFGRFGGSIVIVARFFEVLRQLNGVMAGIGGMPWWRFLLYNGIGAALWVGLWGGGVYLLGRHMEMFIRLFHTFEPYIVAGAVTAAVLALAALLRRRSGG